MLIIMICLHVGEAIPVTRNMTILNKHQKAVLERSLALNCYPNRTTFEQLALKTGLHRMQVIYWFKHKRAAMKKRKGGA